MNRPMLRSDWWALAILCALFAAWLATGRVWLRHLVLGCTFFYIFVVRIVAYNPNNKPTHTCRKKF